jgi:hypothetical protein
MSDASILKATRPETAGGPIPSPSARSGPATAPASFSPVKTKSLPPKKNNGGRPPKFDEPSRPVTLTLPESTLDGLSQIDSDRGQAIVKLTQNALRKNNADRPQVEIMEMAANIGLLIIGPSSALRRIPFLHLVEVAPARFLLAMDPGNDFKNLELAIHDVMEDVPEEDLRERQLIAQLLSHIRNVRKNERVRMAEILFVHIDKK